MILLKMVPFLFIALLLIFNENSCLKIRIEPLKITKIINPNKTEDLITELINQGPYDLLSELLNLNSVDFLSIKLKNCSNMTLNIILKIINDFKMGNLTSAQYETILSTYCIRNLPIFVLKEMIQIGTIEYLPFNLLENPDFSISNLSLSPYAFMKILKAAWNSNNRERIRWDHWSSTIPQSLLLAPRFYSQSLWQDDNVLWQTITFRNMENLSSKNGILSLYLIIFIGFRSRNIKELNLDELIQRCYTLLSFSKVVENNYQRLESDADNNNKKFKEDLFKMMAVLTGNFMKLMQRIEELNAFEADKLKEILKFSLLSSDEQKEKINQINEYFLNFIAASETIQVGDWLLGVLYILSDHISLLRIENISKFIQEFFDRKPSINSVVFLYENLRNKWTEPLEIDNLFEYNFERNPIYLKEIYSSNHRHLLSSKLIQGIPLRMRFLSNLKNRRIIFTKNIQKVLKFVRINNEFVSPLTKIFEMIETFEWKMINLNQIIFVVDSDHENQLFPLDSILKQYFDLILSEKLFYQLQGRDEEDGRPIIRFLPCFPVKMWNQIGHLMSRAILLNIRIPFILELNFFKSVLQFDLLFIKEMSLKIDSDSDFYLKRIYSFLKLNIDINRKNLLTVLSDLYLILQEYKNLKILSSYSNSVDLSDSLISSKRLFRRHSIKELSELTRSASTIELFKIGMESLKEGISSGMNLYDFKLEEAYKILFYTGK